MPRKKKSKKKYKASLQSSNWCFTWNNYCWEDIVFISALIYEPESNKFNKSVVRFIACSQELGEKKKTPHLQGYLQMSKKCNLKK